MLRIILVILKVEGQKACTNITKLCKEEVLKTAAPQIQCNSKVNSLKWTAQYWNHLNILLEVISKEKYNLLCLFQCQNLNVQMLINSQEIWHWFLHTSLSTNNSDSASSTHCLKWNPSFSHHQSSDFSLFPDCCAHILISILVLKAFLWRD